MIKIRLVSFIIFLISFNSNRTFSQTSNLVSQENMLVNLYSKIETNQQDDYDKLIDNNKKFQLELANVLKSNPASLNYSFKKLGDFGHFEIQTSKDGNFRIYSWDTWTGGTMHFYRNMYQWKSKGKVFIKYSEYSEKEEDDCGFYCTKIYTSLIAKKTYYLAITGATFSTKDAMQSITAYKSGENNQIDTIKLFKTKTNMLSCIDVAYDIFSVADRTERPFELITYDDKQKIIYIPVVNNEGQVSDKNILYKLKDGCFEFIGIEKGTRR